MIYLVIVLLLIFFAYRYDYCGVKDGRNFCIGLMFVIFVLLAGLRYRIGGDTINYIYYYNQIHPINYLRMSDFTDSRFAPGYLIVTSICKFFTTSFVLVQMVNAIFVNCVLFWFLRRNCQHIFFALLIFFFFLYPLVLFEQIREAFAVGFFLLAWPAFCQRKWWLWYIFALVAISFHVSAFMMFLIPLFTLPGIKQIFIFGRRTWFICIAVWALGVAIQAVFFRYIEMLMFTESMMERAQTYSQSDLGGSVFNINGILSQLIKFIAYPVVAMYFLQREEKFKRGYYPNEFKNVEFMSLMSVYISLFTISVAILDRYNNYFFLFSIILMSDWAFSKIKNGRKNIRIRFAFWIFIFLPLFSFQFYGAYLGKINKSGSLRAYVRYYPYNTYIEEGVDPKREEAYRSMRLLRR